MKKHLLLLLFATFLSVAFFSGCASTGTKISQTEVDKIQKGKTTKAELIASLGSPLSDSLTGEGKEIMFWSYAQTRIKGSTYVPVVGMFTGGSNTKTTTLQVILNKDKIVEDFLFSNAAIDTKVGG